MKESALHRNFKAMLCFLLFTVTASSDSFAQSQADSLEIYNPFTQNGQIIRILDSYFSPANYKVAPIINQLEIELDRAQNFGERKRAKEILVKLGDTYLRADDNNMALQYYFRARKIAEEFRDSLLEGILNLRIGALYALTEAPLQTNYAAQGRLMLKNVRDEEIQAIVKYSLAREQSDPVQSDSLAREALTLQRRVVARKPNDTTALENLSKYLNGLMLFDEAIAAAEKVGSTRLLIIYINNLGWAKYDEGKYAEALSLYSRSLRLCKEWRMMGLLKNTYHNMSVLYHKIGDYKNSSWYLQLYSLVRESQYRDNNLHRYVDNIVRYEVEAREMANAELALQKDNLENVLRLSRFLEIFLFLGLCALLLLLIMGYFGRKELRKANRLLVQQKEEIISSRQKLESSHRELQESEANLNAAQELAQVANWEMDLTNNKFSFSEMFPKLYGIPKKDFEQNFRKSILSVIHPEDHRQVWENLSRQIWEPGEYESRYRISRNNEIRWILALYKCKADVQTGILKLSGTIQDITLQKEKDEARIKMESERQFAIELIEQQEEERKRIALDIHDGIGQEIVAMKNQAELALTEKDPAKASLECLSQFVRTIPDLLQGLRRISQNLRPVHLERMGLTETILETVRQTERFSSVRFVTTIDNIDNLLPVGKELHIFRIVQEALSNIVKHSGAKNAFVEIRKNGEGLEMEIYDDGNGFNTEVMKQREGFGLHSMASRAQMIGSKLSVVSSRGKGTNIILPIPTGVYGK